MTREPWRPPARRAIAGARAIGQGLLGVALIALAAFVLLPSAHAAQGGATALKLDGAGLGAADVKKGDGVDLDFVPGTGATANGKPVGAPS